MMELLALIVGLAVGAGAGYVVCSALAKAHAQQQIAQAQARSAGAEASANELRTQAQTVTAEKQRLSAELDAERQARVKAATQCEAAVHLAEEQKALLEQSKTKLGEAFKALSGDALAQNNQSFLELAKQTFQAVLVEARGDLSKRQEAIDGLIRPLKENLDRYETHVKAIEASRVQAYASLEQQIKNLASSEQQLQKETGNLVTALRAPQVRGRWGELTLHRVVELAGMNEHCDYTEQMSVTDEDNRLLRPDMVVHLPSGRDIVVDSKVSLEAYLRAVACENGDDRSEQLKRHAEQIRTHMQKLSSKAYWEQFGTTPEFVVMFIPGESFFAAALDCDSALLEDGMKQRVVLATPTTLIALLQAVAYGWRQEKMAQNAKAALDLVREFYDRIQTLASYVVSLGANIRKTTEQYNKVVGSMETRLLPSARKLKEMGLGGDEIDTVEPLEIQPRALTAEEFLTKPPVAEA